MIKAQTRILLQQKPNTEFLYVRTKLNA